MNLPNGGKLYQNSNGIWQFEFGKGSRRVRKSTGTSDQDLAIKKANCMVDSTLLRRVGMSRYAAPLTVGMKDYAAMYRNTRKNAAARDIAFELSKEDFDALVKRSKDACEITGIIFQKVDLEGKYQRQPFFPSIDRIDCTRGYSFGNCRLVCVAVNFAINSWGEWVLHEIAIAMNRTRVMKTTALARRSRRDRPARVPVGNE